MSNTSPFVLPTGISLSMSGNSLTILHDGDVVLEQALGRRLAQVEAGGDLTLRMSPITGVLQAGGTLTCEGDIDAQELRGDVVIIGEGKVRARVIVAKQRVEIGQTSLSVDVIVAPEVFIHPEAQGRVRIVDCLNEQPPTRVRGCLSLADYEADFGGSDEFMARRNVTPVERGPEDVAESVYDEPEPIAYEEDVVVEEVDDPLTDASDSVSEHLAAMAELSDSAFEPVAELQDEDEFEPAMELGEESIDDDVSEATVIVSKEDAEILASPFDDDGFVEVEDADDDEADMDSAVLRAPITQRPRRRPGYAKSRKAITRVRSAYDKMPPPAAKVAKLVAEEDFDYLAQNLDTLWSDLLRHHAAQGTPPPRAAILGFHQLHSMLG